MLRVLQLALPIICKWEGFRANPYLCPKGIPTIGYGSTFYLDGRKVSLRDPPITKEHALLIVIEVCKKRFLPAINKIIPGLPTNKLAALLSWTYNLGEGNLRSSTMLRKMLAGEWDEVPKQWMRWVNPGSTFEKGLTLRRKEELDLWNRE